MGGEMKKKFVVIADSEPPSGAQPAEEPPGSKARHPASAAPFLPGLGHADNLTKHGPALGKRFPIGSRTRFFMKRFYPNVSLAEWNDWKWQLRYRIRKLDVIEKMLRLSPDERLALSEHHDHLPLSVTPYYASLLDERDPNQPLRRSMIPVTAERLHGSGESDDPLHEDADSPVPGLVHRYPDRVLFLTTGFCSAYCRYCTRSRMVGGEATLTPSLSRWEKAVEYIRSSPQVRDVVISGGDPLTMADDRIEWLLSRLRKIPHVEIVRLGTKVPVVLPQRITSSLTRMLRKYHPLWMSIHFTHPDEMTREVTEACSRLADAGIPMGSQTVLLAGINDNVDTMRRLVHGLLKVRVKPYYLYQCDPISGSGHFRTPVEKGIEIIQGLRGHTSGYAIPTYVIDAPGGGGKVPISPQYSVGRDGDYLLLRNYEGGVYRYPDPLNGDAQNCPVWPGA